MEHVLIGLLLLGRLGFRIWLANRAPRSTSARRDLGQRARMAGVTSPRGPVDSPPPGEPGWWPAADGQWYPPETSPGGAPQQPQQPQYAAPTQYAAPNPYGQPVGYAPVNTGFGGTPQFPGQKSKIVAGLLQLCLAGLGIGRFYLGYTSIGVAQILVTIFTCGIGSIWGLIDGIMILTGSVDTDADGRPLY